MSQVRTRKIKLNQKAVVITIRQKRVGFRFVIIMKKALKSRIRWAPQKISINQSTRSGMRSLGLVDIRARLYLICLEYQLFKITVIWRLIMIINYPLPNVHHLSNVVNTWFPNVTPCHLTLSILTTLNSYGRNHSKIVVNKWKIIVFWLNRVGKERNILKSWMLDSDKLIDHVSFRVKVRTKVQSDTSNNQWHHKYRRKVQF